MTTFKKFEYETEGGEKRTVYTSAARTGALLLTDPTIHVPTELPLPSFTERSLY